MRRTGQGRVYGRSRPNEAAVDAIRLMVDQRGLRCPCLTSLWTGYSHHSLSGNVTRGRPRLRRVYPALEARSGDRDRGVKSVVGRPSAARGGLRPDRGDRPTL